MLIYESSTAFYLVNIKSLSTSHILFSCWVNKITTLIMLRPCFLLRVENFGTIISAFWLVASVHGKLPIRSGGLCPYISWIRAVDLKLQRTHCTNESKSYWACCWTIPVCSAKPVALVRLIHFWTLGNKCVLVANDVIWKENLSYFQYSGNGSYTNTHTKIKSSVSKAKRGWLS